jgi:hypothetical protein
VQETGDLDDSLGRAKPCAIFGLGMEVEIAIELGMSLCYTRRLEDYAGGVNY